MKRLIYIFPVLLLLHACVPGTRNEKAERADFYTVESDKFSLRVPSYMSEARNLNDEATLQYQNVIKNIFCIVLEENISAVDSMLTENDLTGEYAIGLEGYCKLVRDQFIENVGEGIISGKPYEKLAVEGLEGFHFEADANVENIDIHYHYGIVKGKSTYYQVLTWTTVNKKGKYKDTMMEILKSFKEKQ